MRLALTGCCKSPLSLASLYNLMSERFQGPACDGACYAAATQAISLLSMETHTLGLVRKMIICLAEAEAFTASLTSISRYQESSYTPTKLKVQDK